MRGLVRVPGSVNALWWEPGIAFLAGGTQYGASPGHAARRGVASCGVPTATSALPAVVVSVTWRVGSRVSVVAGGQQLLDLECHRAAHNAGCVAERGLDGVDRGGCTDRHDGAGAFLDRRPKRVNVRPGKSAPQEPQKGTTARAQTGAERNRDERGREHDPGKRPGNPTGFGTVQG